MKILQWSLSHQSVNNGLLGFHLSRKHQAYIQLSPVVHVIWLKDNSFHQMQFLLHNLLRCIKVIYLFIFIECLILFFKYGLQNWTTPLNIASIRVNAFFYNETLMVKNIACINDLQYSKNEPIENSCLLQSIFQILQWKRQRL